MGRFFLLLDHHFVKSELHNLAKLTEALTKLNGSLYRSQYLCICSLSLQNKTVNEKTVCPVSVCLLSHENMEEDTSWIYLEILDIETW